MPYIHLLNRGVDKRNVFLDSQDYARFIHGMYIFNNEGKSPGNLHRTTHQHHANVRHRMLNIEKSERETLVRIHAFCLMPNHYHMLVTPRDMESLSRFMKRLNMGYAKYFNERYARDGALWQGKYKKVLIERDAHFLYIPHYIHANPLDITHPEWRTSGVSHATDAWKSLMGYRWTSLLDYVGIRNFPSVLYMHDLSDILKGKNACKKDLLELVTKKENALSDTYTLLES